MPDSVIEPKSEHSSEFEEFDTTQVLSEQVCWIVICAYVEDFNFFVFHKLPHIMIVNVDMFRPTLCDGIGADEYCSLIIRADGQRSEFVADLL